jgi:hypothetical protein
VRRAEAGALVAGAAQLVELALQRADLYRVEEGREPKRGRFAQLLDSSFQLFIVELARSSS